MTTSSANSISSINATSTSSKRLSGLVSGLDTDTLVQQLTSGTQSKIDKVQQNRQLALWKQQAYREVTKALTEFSDTYFSSSSSTSSLLNAAFFNSTTIKNTSSFLNVSGSSTAAQTMAVTKISQLAVQASFTSTHDVSTQKIQTGSIVENWTTSAVAGSSITIKYGDKDYKVAVPSDFMFSTVNPDSGNTQEVIDALNDSISQIDDLKGKISFSLEGGIVKVQKDLSAEDFSIKDGTDSLLSAFNLTKGDTKASVFMGTEAVDSRDFYKNTIASGSKLTFNIDGKEYTLKTTASILLDPSKPITDQAKVLQTALAREIDANSDLKGKLSVAVDNTGAVTFSSTGTMSITGGSQNMLLGLGLSNGDGTYKTTGSMTQSELIKTHLVDSLAGSTLTFSMNGLSKTVTFNESEKASYTNAADVATYLQNKLTSAFGADKVTVAQTDGKLSFTTSDPSSIFSIVSSDAIGVLGQSGALRVYAGETNRMNTNKTLKDISGDLATPLTGADSYTMTVNGKDFTFKKSATLASVISTINNDAEANVSISYSSITDNFTVTAKNGGETSKVEIADKTGNLAASLFGTDAERNKVTGQDAILSMSFNGASPITITRSENKFTMDGVNFELLKETDGTVSETTPIKFTSESNVDDLYDKIEKFIDDYNTIITTLNAKVSETKPTDGTYAPLTDAQKKEMSETQITNWETKAKQGLLQGDTILDSLSTDLRRAVTDQVESIRSALYEFGITGKEYDYSGKLVINETKLKQALTENPDKMAELFTGSDGIATRVQDVIKKNIGTFGGDGILIQKAGKDNSTTTDQSTIAKMVKEYDTQIDNLKTRLETQQEQYYAKFTQLEQYLSTMNSQASWFSSNSQS